MKRSITNKTKTRTFLSFCCVQFFFFTHFCVSNFRERMRTAAINTKNENKNSWSLFLWEKLVTDSYTVTIHRCARSCVCWDILFYVQRLLSSLKCPNIILNADHWSVLYVVAICYCTALPIRLPCTQFIQILYIINIFIANWFYILCFRFYCPAKLNECMKPHNCTERENSIQNILIQDAGNKNALLHTNLFIIKWKC